ncbi:Flavorubredoxin [Thermanaeromonas toyohensis ToBE]|uniref:Flavorubredoxin n=1 Tax=Thermanaeromonas toyohensis ToBE TaxID=698762 RepID=A0A1W1VNG6_9FIRM|nr:flavodoxin domain-containing protein [Thermanaeromonas toyohensis]SMB94925.1 Flavorubredoxin [Thermanaeromonas toyohensis ToBE]
MGRPVALGEGIYWVGAIDWNIRYFHGPAFSTPRGTTYNAYLIVDDKIALVDTVYGPFAGELIGNLKSLINPVRLDYLIINHTEIDHSGAFPAIMDLCPDALVLCTQRGLEGLKAYYGREFKYKVVKTGDVISLGRRSLKFIEAPMLHWPDSMFTYIPEEGLLLPNDAFGQHLATTARFDDEVDELLVMDEAAKYYANILFPFSHLITKKLEEIQKMGLVIKTIAPSHGIIWRQNPSRIIEAYARWAECRGKPKAIIAYDTMWGSTEKMAYALLEGLSEGGIEVKLFKISVSDRNEIIKELLEARAVFLGSPTINNDVLPAVSPLLDDLVGLRPKNKLGVAFGAYGWGGGAQKVIEERLKAAKIEVIEANLTVQWVPSPDDLKRCQNLGREIASRIGG